MNRRHALCLVGASVTGLTVPEMLKLSAAAGPADDRALLEQFDTFLSSFHIHKKDPRTKVETSHYCMRLSDDVLQCILFHAQSKKLLGVEYIITDRRYRQLPLEEKAYWHPHSYEVLSGQLIAPGLPAEQSEDLMRNLVTTWGKTWQTWPDPALDVPEGEPLLMWSITRDGDLPAKLLSDRDRRFKVSTRANRARRQAFGHPVPQVEPPESVQEIGRQWNSRKG